MKHPTELVRQARKAFAREDYITAGKLCDQVYEIVFDEYLSDLKKLRALPEQSDLIPGYKKDLESLVRISEDIIIAKLRILKHQ